MSWQLRVQFSGAIYHVTSRGNRRQDIFLDDLDRDTFFGRIGDTVYKYAWEMFAAVLMTNHFHLFFRTPQPNLSLARGQGQTWSDLVIYLFSPLRGARPAVSHVCQGSIAA